MTWIMMLIAMTAALLVVTAFTLGSQLLGIWLWTGSAILAAITAIIVGVVPWFIFRYLKKRRMALIEEQLPDALQLLSGAVKAGLSLPGAIKQIATELPVPLSQEFQMMLQEQRLGLALDDSLENLTHRAPLQSISLMVSAMRISNETGGSLAETLDRAAQTLRSQFSMERKIKALTAQGKMQAWVVGLLPVLLFFVLNEMEPEAMGMLWTTRIGWGVVVVVLTLEFFGVWLIRKIVAIDV